MKTLADMTPEERAQCVGMWATNHAYTGDGESVGVIACIQHHRVWLIHTDINGEWSVFPTDGITPRPDLPRAWQADGQPPAGEWEHAEYLSHYRGMTDVYHLDGAPTHRRWVGEWETVEEVEEA